MNLTEREQFTLNIINDNIKYFNRNRHKGKLSIKLYVEDGNKADVLKDDKRILACVPIEMASGAIVAICNYMTKYDS